MKRIMYGVLTIAMLSLLAACVPTGGMTKADSASMAPESMAEKKEEPMMDSKPMAEQEGEKMMAPDFEMQDLAGNTVKLSDYSGENVYIKYWASWCPICLGGLEDINTLSAEEKDFQVLTIVSPGSKGEKDAEAFKTWFAGVENTANITVLLDEKGAYSAAAGVRGYPTSEWIGKEQNILGIAPGHQDNDQIKAGFSEMS